MNNVKDENIKVEILEFNCNDPKGIYNELVQTIQDAKDTTVRAQELTQQLFNDEAFDKLNHNYNLVFSPLDRACESLSVSLIALEQLESLLHHSRSVNSLHTEKDLKAEEAPESCDDDFDMLQTMDNLTETVAEEDTAKLESLKSEAKFEKVNPTDSNRFICSACSYTSHKPYLIKIHERRLHKIKKVDFACEREDPEIKHFLCQKQNCHYSSTNEAAVQTHFLDKHSKKFKTAVNDKLDEDTEIKDEEDGNKYNCSKCDYVTSNKVYFQDHESGSQVYRKCPWCDAHFAVKKERLFGKHLRNKHSIGKDGNLWDCPDCGQEFRISAVLVRHMLRNHKLGSLLHCPHCQYSTDARPNFRAHVETHESLSYPCEECTHVAKSKFRLRKHVYNTHSRCKCVTCGIDFKNKNTFLKHNKTEHGLDNTSACCDICGLFFSSQGTLTQHRLRRHAKVVLPCDQCNYSAHSKANLYYHISKMHKDKSYLCDQCDFSTSRRQDLQQHISVKHSKVRFRCSDCEVTCSSLVSLKRHQLKHTTAKSIHKCEQQDCDYHALTVYSLKLHMEKIHKGVRWPCQLCSFVGGYKGDTKRHIKIVHEGFSLKCSVCEYSTTKQYYLKGHMLKNHGIQSQPSSDDNKPS